MRWNWKSAPVQEVHSLPDQSIVLDTKLKNVSSKHDYLLAGWLADERLKKKYEVSSGDRRDLLPACLTVESDRVIAWLTHSLAAQGLFERPSHLLKN